MNLFKRNWLARLTHYCRGKEKSRQRWKNQTIRIAPHQLGVLATKVQNPKHPHFISLQDTPVTKATRVHQDCTIAHLIQIIQMKSKSHSTFSKCLL